jgi:hypothetical protein
MAHWNFWEWPAYASLWIAAVILFADGGLRMAPDVRNRLPPFLQFLYNPWLAFVPLALLIIGTLMLLGNDLGLIGRSDTRDNSPSAPMADIKRLDLEILRIVKLEMLRDARVKFGNLSNEHKTLCGEILSEYKDGKVKQTNLERLRSNAVSMQGMAKNFLNQALDFQANPNFDRNPHVTASGEERIATDAAKWEYRKLSDQCTTAELKSEIALIDYDAAIQRMISEITDNAMAITQ